MKLKTVSITKKADRPVTRQRRRSDHKEVSLLTTCKKTKESTFSLERVDQAQQQL